MRQSVEFPLALLDLGLVRHADHDAVRERAEALRRSARRDGADPYLLSAIDEVEAAGHAEIARRDGLSRAPTPVGTRLAALVVWSCGSVASLLLGALAGAVGLAEPWPQATIGLGLCGASAAGLVVFVRGERRRSGGTLVG